MSARDIEGDRIVELVAAGNNTFTALVRELHLPLPHSPALRNAITRLVEAGRLREDGDHLHTVGHDLMEDLEES